ncbi:MAG: nucleotide exchange factor GrpE [Bordetella sp.]|nr:MAG: nucleotide exchange factor GrpE [Bordetella sp.]
MIEHNGSENQLSNIENDELSPLEKLQSEIDQLRVEIKVANEIAENQKDQFLRASAELENLRKRNAEDMSKARKFSIEGFAQDLIPVKDSLEAALDQKDQTVEILKKGVDAIHRQLFSVFDRNQIKEIAPENGDKFDPHLHQAVSSIKPDNKQENNTIAQLLQKGYTIFDRTLRPAMVIIVSNDT